MFTVSANFSSFTFSESRALPPSLRIGLGLGLGFGREGSGVRFGFGLGVAEGKSEGKS
jgi:hypothetical protein